MNDEEKIKVTVSVTNAKDENIEKLIDLPNTEEKIKVIIDEVCPDDNKDTAYCFDIVESNCEIFNCNIPDDLDVFGVNDLLTRLNNLASIEQIKGIIEFDERIPVTELVELLEKGYYEFYEDECLENIDEIIEMGYHQTKFGVIKEDANESLFLETAMKMLNSRNGE